MRFKKNNTQSEILICMFLFFMAIAVYGQVNYHEFTLFDDPDYITKNIHVKSGLTKNNIIRAFRFSQLGDSHYYHPLTMLSHMIDCHFFGLSPGAHHLVNVLFHLLNTALLFFVLKLMTGQRWKSAFVAALFTLHPFNVDTVAWISERKNLLSTFFWLLTILAYTFYVKKKSIYRYVMVFISMLIGLLAKPILVTIPFVLLLMDLWPLGRIKLQKSDSLIRSNYHLIMEKIPLFLLSALWVQISTISNQRIGVLISTETSPMNLRIANALISYAKYLEKMIWPFDLAIFYPYPSKMFPVWQIVGAAVFLISISFLIFRKWKTLPWLTVGWLWYIGTLFPTIGIMQNGLWPAIADRWMYIPLIGIFIIIAWGIPELFRNWGLKQLILTILAVAFLPVLMLQTWNQCSYWAHSVTLFKHALNVTTNNYIAHMNLGCIFAEAGAQAGNVKKRFNKASTTLPRHSEPQYRFGNILSNQNNTAKAFFHINKASRISPMRPEPYYNLGKIMANQDKIPEAIKYYQKSLKLSMGYIKSSFALGNIMANQDKLPEANKYYRKALKYSPDFWEAHDNLGNILEKQGKLDESIAHYKKAIKINPEDEIAHFNLGTVLTKQNKISVAIPHYLKAIRIKPDFAEAHNSLGNGLKNTSKLKEAISHYREALRIKPEFPDAQNNLGAALLKEGKTSDAVKHISKALQLDPDFASAHNNMGLALTAQGGFDKAKQYYDTALKLDPSFTEAYNNLGVLFYHDNKLQKAINHFQTGLKKMPHNTEMKNNLNIILNTLKKIDNAIKNIKNSLKNTPDNYSLNYQLGNMYKKKGEEDKAISQYKKALSLKSDFVPALKALAIIYENRNEYPMAISHLEKIILIQLENNALYYDIACLYAKQNKTEKAIEWLKKAIEKGYTNWESIETDDDLHRIRHNSNYSKLIKKTSHQN